MARERDSRGRFIKKQEPQQLRTNENDREHQIMQAYNRIADGGEAVTEEGMYQREVWMKRSLHALFVVFLIFMAWLFTSCRTKRVVEYVPVERKVTETVTLVDTLVEVQLVPYKETVSVADSSSYLENLYAYSDASIRGGVLNHTLGIKPENPLYFPIQLKFIHIHDSIPYPVPGPVQNIEKDLSRIEKGLMGVGLLSIGAVVVFAAGKIKKWIPIFG